MLSFLFRVCGHFLCFLCVEFDRKRTIYNILQNISKPHDTILSSTNQTLRRTYLPVTAAKDVVLPANVLRPIGSSLAVNQVLHMSTQPRNSRLAPITRSHMRCRVFDSACFDPVDVPRSDPAKQNGLSKELSTAPTSCTATEWKVCLHCLDFVDTHLQLPKVYYEHRVSIIVFCDGIMWLILATCKLIKLIILQWNSRTIWPLIFDSVVLAWFTTLTSIHVFSFCLQLTTQDKIVELFKYVQV